MAALKAIGLLMGRLDSLYTTRAAFSLPKSLDRENFALEGKVLLLVQEPRKAFTVVVVGPSAAHRREGPLGLLSKILSCEQQLLLPPLLLS